MNSYIIAGGGTAGLTMAARLSEIPEVNVGVIEAGTDHTEDELVLTPGLANAQWNNPDYVSYDGFACPRLK